MTLPSGTVSLLFTDIEGSTRLLHELGDRYAEALGQHRGLLREAFTKHGGVEVDTQGDAFFIAFQRAPDAIAAAADAQVALAAASWPDDKPVRVRMGIHTGTPTRVAEGYVGIDVHRGARICAVGHGGQVLVSAQARATGVEHDFKFRDLGDHALKDLAEPQQLYQLLIRGLAEDFPPLRSLRPTNLPTPASSLVGRSAELRAIVEQMRRGGVRLLTLTGAGGSGKTRLCIEAARRLLDDYPAGCFFVGFASVSESDLIVPTIGRVLGIRDASGALLLDAIGRRVAGKKLLLALDNLEHLPKAGLAVSEILSAAPELNVLATSRQPLHLSGETRFAVPPLDLPDTRHDQELGTIARSEAVALFVERARAVDPNFDLTDDNAKIVAEICARLDGLPLAIELATARLSILSPAEILARLDDRLSLLTVGGGDLPERQQTLAATIEWSFNLLDPNVRATLATLSVFAESFTMDAATFVCRPNHEIELVDHLQALTDFNLLVRRDVDADRRLGMLETVAEFSRNRLEDSGVATETRMRHADYYIELTERGDKELMGPNAATWARTLDREMDNIRRALRWLAETKQTDQALRLLVPLARCWTYHGRFSEALQWRDRFLPGVQETSQLAAKAYRTSGDLAVTVGDYRGAEPLLLKARSMFEEMGDVSGMAEALNGLARLEICQAHWEASVAFSESAVAAARKCTDRRIEVRALRSLAVALAEKGEFELAATRYEEAALLARELEYHWEMSIIRANMSWFSYIQGDYIGARSLGEESLAESNALGLARTNAPQLHTLGLVALRDHELRRARDLLIEGLVLSHENGEPFDWASCADGLAGVAAVAGEYVAAARLFGAATESWGRIDAPLPPFIRDAYETNLSSARRDLGEARWEDEFRAGRAMTPDETHQLAEGLLE
ncbi:MAG: adenylate/guanylate cyclase domain-containing protein [Actinomycetota bacterium]